MQYVQLLTIWTSIQKLISQTRYRAVLQTHGAEHNLIRKDKWITTVYKILYGTADRYLIEKGVIKITNGQEQNKLKKN